jgi:hypothetical protein
LRNIDHNKDRSEKDAKFQHEALKYVEKVLPANDF